MEPKKTKLSELLQVINDRTLSLLGIMSKNRLMAELESEELQKTLSLIPPKKNNNKQKKETKKTESGLSPTHRTK